MRGPARAGARAGPRRSARCSSARRRRRPGRGRRGRSPSSRRRASARGRRRCRAPRARRALDSSARVSCGVSMPTMSSGSPTSATAWASRSARPAPRWAMTSKPSGSHGARLAVEDEHAPRRRRPRDRLQRVGERGLGERRRLAGVQRRAQPGLAGARDGCLGHDDERGASPRARYCAAPPPAAWHPQVREALRHHARAARRARRARRLRLGRQRRRDGRPRAGAGVAARRRRADRRPPPRRRPPTA